MKRDVVVQLLFQTLSRLKEEIFGSFQKRKKMLCKFFLEATLQTNIECLQYSAQYFTQPLCIL